MKPLPPNPVLTVGELTMRPIAMTDGPDWYEWLSMHEIAATTSFDVRSLSDVRRIIDWFLMRQQAGEAVRWMIRDADRMAIGTVGFNAWDTRSDRAELGYDLRPSHWGRGIMARTCAAVIDFAFEHGVNRLEATVLTGNDRSARVLARLGFKSEGVLREYVRVRGVYRDLEMFSLLRREWAPPER